MLDRHVVVPFISIIIFDFKCTSFAALGVKHKGDAVFVFYFELFYFKCCCISSSSNAFVKCQAHSSKCHDLYLASGFSPKISSCNFWSLLHSPCALSLVKVSFFQANMNQMYYLKLHLEARMKRPQVELKVCDTSSDFLGITSKTAFMSMEEEVVEKDAHLNRLQHTLVNCATSLRTSSDLALTSVKGNRNTSGQLKVRLKEKHTSAFMDDSQSDAYSLVTWVSTIFWPCSSELTK